jgi:hypothetical protein
MKISGKTKALMVVCGMVAILCISCGGGGGSSSGGGLTISGVVSDENGIIVPGATVTLRKSDHSTVATTTSSASGAFTLSNVPASTDIYINVSMASYAGTNTEIVAVTTSASNADIMIVNAASAKDAADAFMGSVVGASWTDAAYAGKGWFFITTEDSLGNPAAGVSVYSAPSVSILYNDGNDNFIATGPTVSSLNMPEVGGHNSTTGVYTFTLTKSATTYTVKLPLVLGEITGTWTGPF